MTSPMDPNDPLYTPEPSPGIDLSKLSSQELKLYRLYGKLPKTNDILRGQLRDRKFFDSGDYAMSKAKGMVSDSDQVGIINPLRSPEIENVARINRNSVVAGSVSGASEVVKKSKLEEDATEKR